jgi:hypothetical protein
MPQPTSVPPRLAIRILVRLLPEYSREVILGDLQETFAQIEVERGAAFARSWYWHETLAALPNFALHSLQSTQIRRQTVNGNTWNDNWFGKQNSLIAGVALLLLLPALLIVVPGLLFSFFGKPIEASLNSVPGAAQLLAWVDNPIIVLGGLFIALVINLMAVMQIKLESVEDTYRAIFTVRRKTWNLILLGLAVFLTITLLVYAIGENLLPLL